MLHLGLDPETADAALMTMSPFDWHDLATKKDLDQLATKADLELVRSEMATKTDVGALGTELRTEMHGGFAQLSSTHASRQPSLRSVWMMLRT